MLNSEHVTEETVKKVLRQSLQIKAEMTKLIRVTDRLQSGLPAALMANH